MKYKEQLNFWVDYAKKQDSLTKSSIGFELSLLKWEELSNIKDKDFEEEQGWVMNKCGLCFEAAIDSSLSYYNVNCANCLFNCFKNKDTRVFINLFHEINHAQTPKEFRKLCKQMKNYIYNYVTG